MIQPVYVTFEQAKWLKEKGFDSITIFMYGNQNIPQLEKYNEAKYNLYDDYYLAPEQWQVVEWLRVNYGTFVVPFPELLNGVQVKYYPSIFIDGIGEDIEQYFDIPQEAYSAAFDYIMNNQLI